ncbi:MAG: formate dehydrogenase accessory sulfurtransferase FdhD [Bacillota bacterium]|nr:formate dehydrogenase accessory sulfurtransferase FdhD [Bacillota bacterium]
MQIEIDDRIQKIGAYMPARAKGTEQEPPPAKTELHCLIYLNGKLAADTGCTPLDVDMLVLGKLAALGLVRTDEVTRLRARLLDGRPPALGTIAAMPFIQADVEALARKPSYIKLRTKRVGEAARAAMDMLDMERVKPDADCLFACGVSDGEKIRYFQDIFLTNAFYKTLGFLIFSGMAVRRAAVVVGGCITGEAVAYAARCGVPALLSTVAPTSAALFTARGRGVALYTITGEKIWRYA